MLFKKEKFKIVKFEKSKVKQKKYTVYLRHRETLKIYKLHFGDSRYEQYFDKLGRFSHLDHLDKKRRKLYRLRHRHTYDPKIYSSSWFSWRFLW